MKRVLASYKIVSGIGSISVRLCVVRSTLGIKWC